MQTTVIGSYPKPESLKLPDWFERQTSYSCVRHTSFLNLTTDLDDLLLKATKDVIEEQTALGLDVITDGEIRRENYIYYLCRHLNGISFDHITPLPIRNGACHIQAPTIVSEIKPQARSKTTEDWQSAQSMSSVPVKATIPGPMTISDSVADGFYYNEDKLSSDLVTAINHEIRTLAAAGCKHIQIDEPLMARKPGLALSKGIQNIELCFANIPDTVEKTVHICCGYPNYLVSLTINFLY
jgi:5-methyltetrahydropteroyltriglutamate--homocysteine methyltransferase